MARLLEEFSFAVPQAEQEGAVGGFNRVQLWQGQKSPEFAEDAEAAAEAEEEELEDEMVG